MNKLSAVLMSVCLSLAAGSAFAQKKDNEGAKGVTEDMPVKMTMKQCQDHMAMQKKAMEATPSMKKDDATMKKDTMCADMMKKDSMGSMKK